MATNVMVIDAAWFTDMTMGAKIIGIVLGKDEITGEVKAYLGVGSGFDEGRDAERIIRLGQKFDPKKVIDFLGRATGVQKNKQCDDCGKEVDSLYHHKRSRLKVCQDCYKKRVTEEEG